MDKWGKQRRVAREDVRDGAYLHVQVVGNDIC